jgi:transposase-like protein
MAKEVRRRLSEKQWRELVEMWRQTGQSAEAFASERGLNAKTLGWWASELVRRDRRGSGAKKKAPAAAGAATFLPVRIVDPIPSCVDGRVDVAGARAEIALADGLLFRVPVGSDEAWMARVVVALDGARAC